MFQRVRLRRKTRRVLRMLRIMHPDLTWRAGRNVFKERTQLTFIGRHPEWPKRSRFFFADVEDFVAMPLWALFAIWESSSEVRQHESRFGHRNLLRVDEP